jgi:hypothetical protein
VVHLGTNEATSHCSDYLAYWNTSYDKEEHMADNKSFISSLNMILELFSGFAISRSKHPSQSSQPYYNVVLIQVRYIPDRGCFQIVHFNFLRTLTCLKE